MTDRVGQQLGNYRLLRLLGRGGFADVYLGEHIYLKKPAALKVLHLRLDEQDAVQFLHEAQTLAGLDHPHIVRVFDFAVQDGMPFLVMDYAVGGTLRTRHPAGTRVPLERILAYVTQVASALQYAHNQRLIHRDVKPENMLLGAREEALLGDFGLAMLTPSTHSGSTQAMDPAMAGTAPYLAPEQVQGRLRPASDQYALGVVVYEWLCGQRPFRGTPIEVAMQHVSAPPPSLHEQLPDLLPAVEEVIMRALAKEPKDRFACVQDFATALAHASLPTPPPLPASVPSTRSEARRSTPRAEPMWKVPTSFRPLLGREQDVVAICALLSRPEARLVTLVGTGGVGKTRLSLEVATRVRDAFTDGVCFVGLAAISDPDLVLPTLAYELGVQEGGVQSLPEQVKVALQDKHLLLILDNFEQVARAALQVADLLAACPRLKVLVTSRVVLHTQAEYEFPLPPLALPPLTRLPEGEALAQYAAVALFLERARALKPNFQLTPANARVIAEICVRLDGLPLAIELAAAWIKLLPPQALLARLEHRLEILTSRARDVPIRQQTLRNTLIWSYDLLDAQEQWLFRQLSVFVGGCTLEATEEVCNILGNIAVNVLGTLASLIDKNLLQQLEQANGVPRLQMMATIREYGLECLAAHGETEVVRRAHAEYYLKLAEEVEPKLFGAERKWWFDRLEQEYENLRAALHWSVERGELEVALRLGGALWRFWLVRGYLSEELVWLEPAIKGIEGVRASVRAKALISAGALAHHHGDIDRAEALCRESLALFRELGDIQGIAVSLHRLGQVASVRSNYTAARSLEEEALQLFKEVDDKEGMAYSLTDLAYGAIDQGEFMRARLMAEEGLALFRMSGDKRGIIYALLRLGRVYYFSQEDQARAYSLAEEALKISREVGYKWGMASSLGLLGQLILNQGDTIAAYSLLEEALVLRREIDDRWGIAWGLYSLGWVAFDQSDYSVAKALFEECLAILSELEDKEFLASGLEALGAVVSAQGDLMWAAQLWGAAETLREIIGAPIAPASRATYERLVAEARAQLSEEIFAARWAEGRSMSPEQALAAQATAEGPLPPPIGPPSTPPVKMSPAYPAGLTTRELEVLRLLAKGLTSAQIAEQLVIGLVTVNSHIRSIYSKLGVSSRSAATRLAVEQHLV